MTCGLSLSRARSLSVFLTIYLSPISLALSLSHMAPIKMTIATALAVASVAGQSNDPWTALNYTTYKDADCGISLSSKMLPLKTCIRTSVAGTWFVNSEVGHIDWVLGFLRVQGAC